MRYISHALLGGLLGSWLLAGCAPVTDPDTAGQPADRQAAEQVAHEAPATANPVAEAPPTLLGGLRALTDQLAAIPTTAATDRDAAHHLAEYCHGAIGLAETELKYGRDTARQHVAAWVLRQQQPLLGAAQRLTARLDAATARGQVPAPNLTLRQQLATTRQQLVEAVQASVGAAGRESHAPNLAYMQGHHDEGTGNVDADFATLLLEEQVAAGQASQAVQQLGRDAGLRALADQLLTGSRRTVARLNPR